jgi:adenosylcobinamide kinase/adenosylcobinamide-phosphate guanylyltransferase
MDLTLVLGGTRSGKSAYAEGLVTRHPPPWVYLATAEPRDEEMQQRIESHRLRRGDGWRTEVSPTDLAGAFMRPGISGRPVLVDCLTLWTSNLMLAGKDVDHALNELEIALTARDAPTVLVSSEIGLGIVPDNALARRFRDEAGRINQRFARQAARVVFVVAGLPMAVKGGL